MAQLNEAIETMESVRTDARESPPPGPASGDRSRTLPVWPDAATACGICGWGPAVSLGLFRTTGLILLWRWERSKVTLCRFCARWAYNDTHSWNLVGGWWGIIAPVATLVAFVRNLLQAPRIRRIPPPLGRLPGHEALSPLPLLEDRPWWRRIAPVLTTSAVLILVSLVASAALTSPTSTASSSPDSPVDSGSSEPSVGECWADAAASSVQLVSCNSSVARYQTVSIAATPADCPVGTVDYLLRRQRTLPAVMAALARARVCLVAALERTPRALARLHWTSAHHLCRSVSLQTEPMRGRVHGGGG
jgi:hypothetical protein